MNRRAAEISQRIHYEKRIMDKPNPAYARLLLLLALSRAQISDSQENCMPLSPNHRGHAVVYLASTCLVTIIFALTPTTATALPAGNTIIVNSTLDVANSTDGLCTLREAIPTTLRN